MAIIVNANLRKINFRNHHRLRKYFTTKISRFTVSTDLLTVLNRVQVLE